MRSGKRGLKFTSLFERSFALCSVKFPQYDGGQNFIVGENHQRSMETHERHQAYNLDLPANVTDEHNEIK